MAESNEERATDLFYSIMAYESYWAELSHTMNSLIEPEFSILEFEGPRYDAVKKKFDELYGKFGELLDLLKKYREDDMGEFYNLMGWKIPDKEKIEKLVQGVVGATVGAMILKEFCEANMGDEGADGDD